MADAELVGNVFHCALMVAAHDVDINTVRLQAGDGGLAVGFQTVGQRKRADGLAVYRHRHDAGDLPHRIGLFRQS